MGEVTVAWTRIETWLGRHDPASLALLAAPATPADIHGAGLELPPELVESLLRHNGFTEWANLLPEAVPMSVADIARQHGDRMDIAEDIDGFTVHPPNGEPWWHELWIPFGDADGNLQVIDLRDGPGHGRLGLAIHDDTGYFDEGWPSLSAYLTAVADVLENGGTVGAWWSLAGATEIAGEPLEPAPCRSKDRPPLRTAVAPVPVSRVRQLP